MITVAHLVNPVKVTEKSDLYTAQPITFASLLRAKSICQSGEKIGLFTTQFPEDHEIIPVSFQKLSDLSQSVLDVNETLSGKKLPLIRDILAKTKEIESAEYILFTNMDIAVMPTFYDSILNYIAQGHDAVIINRRRLTHQYQSVSELTEMYADLGKSHPGFDCFLFRRELVDQFILSDICVGISFLETALVHNIFSFAKNPLFVPDAHLTFHIGMDVLVPRKNNPFYWHNRKEFFNQIQPKLKPHFELRKFPYAALPLPKRMLKWVLNPSLFTRTYLQLEGKSMKQRLKMRLDEIRWRLLQR